MVCIQSAAAKSLQSCLTLWDPIDGSPPGSTVPGILQATTLEWVAISFSKAGKWKVKVKSLSRIRPLATSWTAAHQAPLSMGFSRQEYWSGCHCLLRSIQSIGLQRVRQDWSDLACGSPTEALEVIKRHHYFHLAYKHLYSWIPFWNLDESFYKKKKKKSGVSDPQDICTNIWEMRVDRRWFFACRNLCFLS